MRHQKAYCVCRQIHAQTAATHHAVPTGAGGSAPDVRQGARLAPDVRQGALGGRRTRLDVVTSGSGSGRAYPARPKNTGRVDTKDFASGYSWGAIRVRGNGR